MISKKQKPALYIKNSKLNNRLKKILLKYVSINPIENVENIFSTVNIDHIVGLDFIETSFYFLELLNKNNIKYVNKKNPCILFKAIKNQIEQKGAINANIRDGVSITKFIYWLKNKMDINNNNEISAAKYLENLRVNNKFFHSLSFDTISAIGKNAALPHYRVNEKSNTNFSYNKIYLVDSGGQYYLARQSLNEVNCDYDHGTGHGIGSFLSVHEAPQRIAKKSMFESVELLPGMILSNEPGFYKLNEYGIRIENLILVKEDLNNNLFLQIFLGVQLM